MKTKCLALVAHDHLKQELADWTLEHARVLHTHRFICTGTTGKLIASVLQQYQQDQGIPGTPDVTRLKSGPLGGDQQLGAEIAEGKVDAFIFFWDPMHPQAHDVDVKALLRIAVLYNIPTASNRATADYLVTSPLFFSEYAPAAPDFGNYLSRDLPGASS